MPTSPVSLPWRRYLRFSVRGLIILVLVIGAGLGWIVREAQVQRDAVAAINKAGGSVEYDWMGIPAGKPWAPSWLVDLIGVDFFGHVTIVNLTRLWGPRETVLVEVGRLNQLQALSLLDASGSDSGQVHLKGLTTLTVLILSGNRVTDEGLALLKGLTDLSSLGLNDTQVTDAGLVHLKGLTNLCFLELDHTQITDAGLVHLKGLTNLSRLDLVGTRVTDAGLVHLKGPANLKRLDLSGTRVTEAGARELNQALPSLRIIL
jgi:Leucine-rich repeat (LRR) protein